MGLFSSQLSYLGVDLGSSSIKVVELENYKGRPKLATYGFTEKSLSMWDGEDILKNPQEVVDAIRSVCAQSKIKSKKAIAALPNFLVFSSILNLPNMDKKDLDSAITWEAKKIIPMPLEDIILDWKIIKEESIESKNGENFEPNQHHNPFKKILIKEKKNLKVILTGASRKLIKKYIDIFSEAGLHLLSLETESFALIRSLLGNDKQVSAIVDLGALTSSITIVDEGIPVLTRSVEEGGLKLTRAIASNLNINLERAEQFKQDMVFDDQGSNSLPQTVEQAFGEIFQELQYTIGLYQDQNSKKIEKIILTGGTAMLGNLSNYLSQKLNINTYVGDPWSRIVYPTDLKPILDRLGSKFSVSIGLAMRDIE